MVYIYKKYGTKFPLESLNSKLLRESRMYVVEAPGPIGYPAGGAQVTIDSMSWYKGKIYVSIESWTHWGIAIDPDEGKAEPTDAVAGNAAWMTICDQILVSSNGYIVRAFDGDKYWDVKIPSGINPAAIKQMWDYFFLGTGDGKIYRTTDLDLKSPEWELVGDLSSVGAHIRAFGRTRDAKTYAFAFLSSYDDYNLDKLLSSATRGKTSDGGATWTTDTHVNNYCVYTAQELYTVFGYGGYPIVIGNSHGEVWAIHDSFEMRLSMHLGHPVGGMHVTRDKGNSDIIFYCTGYRGDNLGACGEIWAIDLRSYEIFRIARFAHAQPTELASLDGKLYVGLSYNPGRIVNQRVAVLELPLWEVEPQRPRMRVPLWGKGWGLKDLQPISANETTDSQIVGGYDKKMIVFETDTPGTLYIEFLFADRPEDWKEYDSISISSPGVVKYSIEDPISAVRLRFDTAANVRAMLYMQGGD